MSNTFMSCTGSVMPKDLCFHLYTLGPNTKSILKCDSSSESTAYAPHLHKNTVLHSRIPYDTLVGLKKPNFSELRVSNLSFDFMFVLSRWGLTFMRALLYVDSDSQHPTSSI